MTQPPAPLRARIRLQILGPVRLWRDGAELAPGPRQQAFLLAVLLARVGQPVSRAELVDLLWGQEIPASALNVMHKYVGSLRRLLEPGLAVREAGSYIQRRGDGYLFDCGTSELDLVTFRRLVEAGRTAAADGEQEAALDRYVEALALWRGPAADGLERVPAFVALDGDSRITCGRPARWPTRSGRRPRSCGPAATRRPSSPSKPPSGICEGRPGSPGRPALQHLKNGTLKTYAGYPHGMLTTHADVLNPDLLAFIQS